MSQQELVPLLEIIEAVRDRSATSESRSRKDKRIQGLIIDERDIHQEITSEFSPFLREDIIPGVENRNFHRIAKEIRDDLWQIAERYFKNKYRPGQEADFKASSAPGALFDSANNIIYIKGQAGSQHFKLLEAFKSHVNTVLKTRRAENNTAHFWLPNQDYIDAYTKANEALIRRADIEKVPSSKRKRWLENQRLRGDEFAEIRGKYGNVNVRGANLGHGFGGAVSTGTNLLSGVFGEKQYKPAEHLPEDISNIELINEIPGEFKDVLKPLVIDLIGQDAKVEYERTLSSNSVLGRITLVLPELEKKNKSEGSFAKKDLANIRAELVRLQEYIIGLRGSPSYADLVRKLVEDTFDGKVPPRRRHTTKATKKGKKESFPVQVHKVTGGTAKVRRKTTKTNTSSSVAPVDLRSIINLINRRLHDKIRENMGKGRSRQVLNYRTGRFAKSARVQNLYGIGEKNALGAEVKYMKNPYSVFEPGGRLNPPAGRDPHRIIGRSIRQILQEEKIANLRRVKVKLNG